MENITKLEIAAAGLTRKELARKIGMPYPSLSARMSGFSPWKGTELERAWKILDRERSRHGRNS